MSSVDSNVPERLIIADTLGFEERKAKVAEVANGAHLWTPLDCRGLPKLRRVRDSNPQALAGASFQDWCNSRSANPPLSR